MKRNRRIIIIVSMVALVAVLLGTIAVASLAGGGGSPLGQKETSQDGDVKYEKPAVGDIAQDGAYPDEVKSNSSAHAQEKEWYEYITYSKESVGEVQEGKTKIIFYDPYDYNYGMIMEISSPESNFGGYYDSEGYTTANEISVTYSVSKSHSWATSLSSELGIEESLEAKAETAVEIGVPGFAGGTETVGTSVGLKFSQSLGVSHTQAGSDDSSASKSVTYNALYFNSDGTPYRWRIVKYTVYLPLYCEVQTLVNGEWVVTNTTYCLLATVQGTCREWINEDAYVEDWRTGEPMRVEDFWKEYYSTYNLLDAYINQLIPQN